MNWNHQRCRFAINLRLAMFVNPVLYALYTGMVSKLAKEEK